MIFVNSKKIRLLLFFFIFQAGLYAQEAVTSAGANISGTGGSVSYTAGQVFYNVHSGSGGSATQCVQQPFEISDETGLPEARGISLSCMVYPNPVLDKLVLKFEEADPKNYSASLYDMNGKLIRKKAVEGSETVIDMSKLEISGYFLKVSCLNKEVKTFKIIKN